MTEPACTHTKRYYQRHVCNYKEEYLIEFWFTEHSIQAFRRHRKHSVINCRLEARCSTWDGSLQASSTAWEDFFKISRTLWKIVLGAVSLKKDKIVTNQKKKKKTFPNVLFRTLLVLNFVGRQARPICSSSLVYDTKELRTLSTSPRHCSYQPVPVLSHLIFALTLWSQYCPLHFQDKTPDTEESM